MHMNLTPDQEQLLGIIAVAFAIIVVGLCIGTWLAEVTAP